MKQLSGADTMFLQFEHGNNFMHVASLAIYDPATAPGGRVRFKDVLRFFAARVEQFPQFRRRLASVPLSLDRPYWVEDSAIDVEFHVRHIALPQPGDWRQLCIQVARLHSRPLDRSKPLWEAYIIEGLHNVEGVPAGSFALYTQDAPRDHRRRVGHRAAQGAALAHAGGGRGRRRSGGRVHRRPRTESRGAVFARRAAERGTAAVAGTLLVRHRPSPGTARCRRRSGNLPELRTRLVPQLKTLLSGDLSPLLSRLPPQTRFSGNVSAHRVFEAVGLPFAELQAVRRQAGTGTINDLFLCIVGGALNRYLDDKGELPDSSMVAMVPMTLRGEEKGGDRGNQVGFTLMPVHSDIADPLERLRAINQSAQTSKRVSDAVGKELARDLLEYLPTPISRTLLRNVKLPGIGLIVSNVRGPDAPLYMAGAQLVNYSPISIPVDGLGLNVTGFSCAGTMWICAVSCREMMPDPAFFAECLRSSFEELKQAAADHAHASRGRASCRRQGRARRAAQAASVRPSTRRPRRRLRRASVPPSRGARRAAAARD